MIRVSVDGRTKIVSSNTETAITPRGEGAAMATVSPPTVADP